MKDKGHNIMSKQKKEERFYLDKFLALLGKVPYEIQSGESPDFIITSQKKKIGVEVTGFHSDLKGETGRPRRSVEETWLLLQGTIMGEVEKHDELKETHGLLFFKILELPPKSKHKKFTDELIKLSLETINSGYREIKPGKNYPILSKYLKKFRLKKIRSSIAWDWSYDFASIGTTEEELINTVRPKIVATYKQKDIDELWLLIVSGYKLSQAMSIRLADKLNAFDQLNRLLSQSNYNKVYIYQYMFDAVYEWPGWVKIC